MFNREKLRQGLLFSTAFVIPLSTVATNLLCLLLILYLCFDKTSLRRLKLTIKTPVISGVLLLITMMIFGLFYGQDELSHALRGFTKYREFIYVIVFMVLFHHEKDRQAGLYGFYCAMGITLLLSYLIAISGLEIIPGSEEKNAVFKSYIIQNVLMALALFFVIVQYGSDKKHHVWLAFLSLFALYNILFMSMGRTGYVVLFSLAILLGFHRYRLKGLMISFGLLLVSSWMLYLQSPLFHQRIDMIVYDFQQYQQGSVEENNSIGSRLQFYVHSLLLIEQHPWLGTGTGSFFSQYKQLAMQSNEQILLTANPHNEYLLIAVQWGIIGLLVYFFWLWIMLRESSKLSEQHSKLAQGLLLSLVLGCLFNSFWLDSTEGHFFAFFIALLYSARLNFSTQE